MSGEGGSGSPKAGTPRTVPCPICGAESVFEPRNRWRPFCSERCRMVDLGAWASESYRVPGKAGEEGAGGEKPEPDE